MKKGKHKKIPLYLIITLLIMLIITIWIILSTEKEYKESINYYTGDIYSLNFSANLIDKIEEDNVVISPLNINQSLIPFYYGSDNITEKEIKAYYKNNIDNTTAMLIEKYNNNKIEEIEKDTFINNYEKLINELYNNNYHELTIEKITNLKDEERKNIQTLIKKINLNYDRMNSLNNMSIKAINKYTLNKKEINNNVYNIKENIDLVLDKYESYCLRENIVNNNNLYYINLNLEKDYLNKLKNTNITINKINSLDEINNLKTYIEHKENELISINTFEYTNEWLVDFDPNLIKSAEFINGNKITAVEMMYEEENTYLENNYAVGFKKDYKNNNYSFIAVLPKKEEYKASNLDLNNFINSEKKGPVKIGLPRFSINSEIDLKELLSNKISFDKSNLSKIDSNNPKINTYIAKSSIVIGDKGSINTKIKVNKKDSIINKDYKKEIILNKPFYFIIINNQTNDVILIGKVSNIR